MIKNVQMRVRKHYSVEIAYSIEKPNSKLPSWVHCNNCLTIAPDQLSITSCHFVICSRCRPKHDSKLCKNCKDSSCQSILLDNNVPQNILFSDQTSLVKPIRKAYAFQENQKRTLLQKLEEKAMIIEQNLQTAKARLVQKKELLDSKQKLNERLNKKEEELEQKLKKLKLKNENDEERPIREFKLLKNLSKEDRSKFSIPRPLSSAIPKCSIADKFSNFLANSSSSKAINRNKNREGDSCVFRKNSKYKKKCLPNGETVEEMPIKKLKTNRYFALHPILGIKF